MIRLTKLTFCCSYAIKIFFWFSIDNISLCSKQFINFISAFISCWVGLNFLFFHLSCLIIVTRHCLVAPFTAFDLVFAVSLLVSNDFFFIFYIIFIIVSLLGFEQMIHYGILILDCSFGSVSEAINFRLDNCFFNLLLLRNPWLEKFVYHKSNLILLKLEKLLVAFEVSCSSSRLQMCFSFLIDFPNLFELLGSVRSWC